MSLLLRVRLDCKGFRLGKDLRLTRNNRQLEQDVERDPEGKITSHRKRGDTQVNLKLDCKWRCTCSFKFAYAGATGRMWILTVTSLAHTHGMRNPFGYKIHVKETTEYKILTTKARHMRFAMISYSDSKRVLQMEGLGFTIDSTSSSGRCRVSMAVSS